NYENTEISPGYATPVPRAPEVRVLTRADHASERRIEALGVDVLVPHPQIQASLVRALQKQRCGFGHEPPADPPSLEALPYMQIVEKRTPLSILVRNGVREADERHVEFGQYRERWAVVGIGETLMPDTGALLLDLVVEKPVREPASIGA